MKKSDDQTEAINPKKITSGIYQKTEEVGITITNTGNRAT